MADRRFADDASSIELEDKSDKDSPVTQDPALHDGENMDDLHNQTSGEMSRDATSSVVDQKGTPANDKGGEAVGEEMLERSRGKIAVIMFALGVSLDRLLFLLNWHVVSRNAKSVSLPRWLSSLQPSM